MAKQNTVVSFIILLFYYFPSINFFNIAFLVK